VRSIRRPVLRRKREGAGPSDAPSGCTGDAPSARTGDAPSARTGDAPSARTGNAAEPLSPGRSGCQTSGAAPRQEDDL